MLIRFILWFVLFPCMLCCTEGLKYECLHIKDGDITVHLLEIDPSYYEIKPIRAMDDGLGRESVLSICKRYGASAAINGGFFTIGTTYDGKPCGALKIEKWYALSTKPRGAIGWSSNNKPLLDRIEMKITLSNGYKVDGFNCPRQNGKMILFNSCFHKTTLTDIEGQELIIVNNKIKTINNSGSGKIPSDGYVLSIHKNHPLFNKFTLGDDLLISLEILPILYPKNREEWENFDYVVGGCPLLINHNVKFTDFSFEKTNDTFLYKNHARTAVGIKPNGHWLFVVIDRIGKFRGMTIDELATLMQKLGCHDALNLDGGRSSTMVYGRDVKNFPQDDETEAQELNGIRRVSDAIVVIPKCKN